MPPVPSAPNVASTLEFPYEFGRGQPDDGFAGSGIAGPRGIESVIEYNGLFMNVREWVDTYLVTNIGGLEDADVRDSREVNPGYHGETAFPGYYGGRTITLTGKVITKTIFKLRDMQQALRRAFINLDRELPLVFRAATPDLDMMIYCRKSQSLQMADEQRTANHFERAFLLTLRASNPRFLSSVRVLDELGFSTATYDAVGLSPTNDGNALAQPTIELTGPMTGLVLFNENDGQRLSLVSAVPPGEVWVYDTARRMMFRQSDSANRFMYLDVNSDWFEIPPGSNNIRVTATGLTTASKVSIGFRNTWM